MKLSFQRRELNTENCLLSVESSVLKYKTQYVNTQYSILKWSFQGRHLNIENCLLIVESFKDEEKTQYINTQQSGRNKKKPRQKCQGFNEYGSYLLSRIVVQYHRP